MSSVVVLPAFAPYPEVEEGTTVRMEYILDRSRYEAYQRRCLDGIDHSEEKDDGKQG